MNLGWLTIDLLFFMKSHIILFKQIIQDSTHHPHNLSLSSSFLYIFFKMIRYSFWFWLILINSCWLPKIWLKSYKATETDEDTILWLLATQQIIFWKQRETFTEAKISLDFWASKVHFWQVSSSTSLFCDLYMGF